MKRSILFLVAVAFAISVSAVQSQSVVSTQEMVQIAPILGSEIQLPEQGRKILSQKLSQIATQNGFGALPGGNIILTANVVVMDEQMTATAPAMIAVEAEVSLVVLNLSERVVLNEMPITVRGVDSNKDRALVKAIATLTPRSTVVRRFMIASREKVLDYYTTRIPALMAKASSFVDRKQYDEAMLVLATIPDSVDEYPAIADMLVDIYAKRLEDEALAKSDPEMVDKAKAAAKSYAESKSDDVVSEVNKWLKSNF